MSEMNEGMGLPKPRDIAEVSKVLDRVCYESNTPDQEGVVFIHKDQLSPAEKAANAIGDGLMYTLGEVGKYSVCRVEAGDENSHNYALVARSTEYLAIALRNLADGKLGLVEDQEGLRKFSAVKDKVSMYCANNVFLSDGERPRFFKEISIFIRPSSTITVISDNEKGKVLEKKEPRMTILIRPAESSMGKIIVRVDDDQARKDKQVVFDLVVGRNSANTVDNLSFSPESLPNNANQTITHHFGSAIRTENFGTTFSETLIAFNQLMQDQKEKHKTDSDLGLPVFKNK